MNLASPLFLEDITTPGVCEIAYQKVLDADDRRYDCRRFRDSIDIDEYFLEVKEIFLKNHEEFVRILMDLKDLLPRGVLDYKTVFGDGDGLSDYMWRLIDSGFVTENEAKRIISQLKRDYDEGIVPEEALMTRISYLGEGVDLSKDIDLFLENVSKAADLCPYCYQPVSLSDRFCRVCGCDISDGIFLDCDRVIDEITDDDGFVVRMGRVNDEFSQEYDDYDEEIENLIEGDDAMNRRLLEIYNNNDEEAFEELLDECPLEITDISQIPTLEDRLNIDLSHYFIDGDEYYMKNYAHSRMITDLDRPVKKHALNEENPVKHPTYSTFIVLNALKKNPNLDEVLESVDIDMNKALFKDFLFAFNLIESKSHGEDFWQWVYDSHDISQLRDILRNNGLDESGDKDELVERLAVNLLYSEFGEVEFAVTDEGEFKLMGSQWILFYRESMDYFDFDDYESYMMENDTGDLIRNSINYLNEHLKIGYETNDFYRLHDVFSAKSLVYLHEEEFKRVLFEELQLFILKLNPVFLSSEELESYVAVHLSNINNIDLFATILDISNLKKTFNRAWGFMQLKDRTVSKKIAFKYLNRAIKGENVLDLSHEISDKYFFRRY